MSDNIQLAKTYNGLINPAVNSSERALAKQIGSVAGQRASLLRSRSEARSKIAAPRYSFFRRVVHELCTNSFVDQHVSVYLPHTSP